MNNATLTLDFGSEENARAGEQALADETFTDDRARGRITRKGTRLIIAIDARDVVALRAAVNSYLRNVQAMDV